MSRPAPLNWFSDPITPQKVQELVNSAVKDRYLTSILLLKSMFAQVVQKPGVTNSAVLEISYADDMSGNSLEDFLAQLRCQGFKTDNAAHDTTVLKAIRISWPKE